jgi:hypothetical protein
LSHCLSPWLRFTYGGHHDARTEDYVASADLRPICRRSHMSDSVVSLVLESA